MRPNAKDKHRSLTRTEIYKKLSCRKQIARQLRRQYVEGICRNSVTLKSGLEGHWNWYMYIYYEIVHKVHNKKKMKKGKEKIKTKTQNKNI